MTDAHQGPSW